MNIAIIETGGKQYTVKEGDLVTIEKLSGAKVGETVTFDKVLLTDDGSKTVVGSPYIKGVTITATLEVEGRGKKIRVQKFKSKSRYTRARGHRQSFNTIKVSKLA